MTFTTTPERRWGVFCRPSSSAPWRLVVSHADKREAERLLIGLAADSKTSGDWRVDPVGCMAAPTPQPLLSKAEPWRGR